MVVSEQQLDISMTGLGRKNPTGEIMSSPSQSDHDMLTFKPDWPYIVS
jgi:hypothetical protein